MSKYVYLYSQTLSAEDLAVLADRYHADFDLPTAVQTTAPELTSPSNWPSLLDIESPVVVRYWMSQTAQLSAMLSEAFPPLNGDAVQDSVLSLLATAWGDDAQGTVVFNRTFTDHGLAIVFQGMSVDSTGKLRVNGAALPLPPHGVFEPALAAADGDGGANQVQQGIWTILKYIADGLSDDTPIIGGFMKLLLDLLGAFTQTATDQMQQLLDDIKKLLQQDRIQIEMDLANATILTWSQYEGSHFQQADLDVLTQPNPDKSSKAYQDAFARISAFVTKINDDLNGTPRLFDAVNLMSGDTGTNPDTFDFPTDSMLKFSYYMFYAGFILAIGKQAWLSSLELNGANSQITTSLQREVTFLSSTYTNYVNQLSASINAQVNTRMGRWSCVDEQPIDSHTFVFIWDNTTNRGVRYYPPSDWGYTGDTVFSYCGNSQYSQALANCNAALAALKTCYQNYMYRRIVKAASEGRTLQQEFNARVSTFQENDKKYQNLAAKG